MPDHIRVECDTKSPQILDPQYAGDGIAPKVVEAQDLPDGIALGSQDRGRGERAAGGIVIVGSVFVQVKNLLEGSLAGVSLIRFRGGASLLTNLAIPQCVALGCHGGELGALAWVAWPAIGGAVVLEEGRDWIRECSLKYSVEVHFVEVVRGELFGQVCGRKRGPHEGRP
jgi:hypothetical protein